MDRRGSRASWARAAAVLAGVALLATVASACGSDDDYDNAARPPAPIAISAVITAHGVQVSPKRIGGGPLVVTIANQTKRSQTAVLEPADGGARRATDPIDPSGTGELRIDAQRGAYTISADGSELPSATLTVGAPRNSSQNDLLQP